MSIEEQSNIYTNACRQIVAQVLTICRSAEIYRPAPNSLFGDWCVQDPWLTVRLGAWLRPSDEPPGYIVPLLVRLAFKGSQNLRIVFAAEDTPAILSSFTADAVDTLFSPPKDLLHSASIPSNSFTKLAYDALYAWYDAKDKFSPVGLKLETV